MYQFCNGTSLKPENIGVEGLRIMTESLEISNQGLNEYDKGKYEKAIKLFNEALSIDPNNHTAFRFLSRVQIMMSEGDPAILVEVVEDIDYNEIFDSVVADANEQDLTVAQKIQFVVQHFDSYLSDIEVLDRMHMNFFSALTNVGRGKEFDFKAKRRMHIMLVQKFSELGDHILELFPKEPAMIKLATTAWKKPIEYRYSQSVYKNYYLKGKVMWWDVLADKIKKYEPDYTLPAFKQQGCIQIYLGIGDAGSAPSPEEDNIDL